ncbi:MAG: HK97 gp10 family phage protein [Brevundimonas sp.]|uniref:HK97-gp10 family putative phage morphogenesis protein n=1 Tax=Brevundimonas sp. TaxID=1871086 RepID=UPI002735D57A|nr:HK97-gp10 family putative phage morphogenesis protein [Brevundimonas sp.]MDP3379103.1 HK97 gp10 family phage protein [Brevundimonas sp.]
MSGRVKIEGLRELEQALMALGKVAAKNVARRTLMKAAQPIADDAAQRAPEETGSLIKSVAASTRNPKRNKKESPVEVHVGPGRSPRAHLQEFGSRRHGPQPFLRPAWEGGKDDALASIAGDLADEIDKAAKRQSRKAARLARKAAG